MLRYRRAGLWIVLALISPSLPLFARQGRTTYLDELKSRIQQRYTVLPIQNGIVLTPKRKAEIVSIEISGNSVAVNGTEVTGAELRSRLSEDAESILQLSYLTSSERQELFGIKATTGASASATPPPPPLPPDALKGSPSRRSRGKNDVVRFGSNVNIDKGETVDGDVAVFGGNARIDGQVNGDVVVIGGTLTIGPEAYIARDVAVVGGTLSRDPKAVVGGNVTEIGGPGVRLGDALKNRTFYWSGMLPVFTAASTLVRIGVLVLFGCVVMLLAGTLANRIGDRAAAEPLRAGVTGLLAELLFFPALVMTIVLLIITILGIPLLLLLPFVVLALAVVFLVGFTGVAGKVGHLIGSRLGWSMGPYLTTTVGIVTLLLPIVVARLLGLAGLNVIAVPLLAAGVLIEYLAWTIGFGAAALTYLRPATPPN